MTVKSYKIEKETRWYRIVLTLLNGETQIVSSFVSEESAKSYIKSEGIIVSKQ